MTLSCIKDSLDGCPQYLRFSYSYNMSGEDLFQSEVKSVRVFVLNDDGDCIMDMEETDSLRLADPSYRMELPSYVACRKVVVWAGLSDSNFKLTPDLGVDLAHTSIQDITPLWHCGPERLLFNEAGRTQTISLVRTTNTVRVVLRGCDQSKASMKIYADSHSYGPDHAPKDDGGIAWRQTAMEGRDTAIFHIMRLVPDSAASLEVAYGSQPITFGGQPMLDLVRYFLTSRPEGMTDREYLDREHIWTVEIDLEGTVALSVTINGWTTWFQDEKL